MKEFWELYMIFFRMGAFTFGGGYAMLPIIQKEIVEKKNWATDEEIIDCYAIGQCTPGIIAVNTATFIGYRQKGLLGGIIATLGMVSPSIVIITIIATFFQQFQDYAIVQHALGGIRVVVVALIMQAVIKMWQQSVKNWVGIGLFTISFILIVLVKLSPIFIVIMAAVTGYVTRNKREVTSP
ncbi:chromate transporter [Clostridium formicaceticum]|uniref:Chromate transport protein n=1 Tax=Clostridium formicaceticum TaxID=1497 RepID=A0AAC9RQX3_9CLOT|nr:chromate transporter [Clostridium formicaceticum]AOY74871.1 chromate transporter [Clostridium formicaceticum]ARE89273.1 Chromate transport protein [Clostridium formicaceticum]